MLTNPLLSSVNVENPLWCYQSEDDYLSLQEIAYIMRSPANLKRLIDVLNRSEGEGLEDVRKTFGI